MSRLYHFNTTSMCSIIHNRLKKRPLDKRQETLGTQCGHSSTKPSQITRFYTLHLGWLNDQSSRTSQMFPTTLKPGYRGYRMCFRFGGGFFNLLVNTLLVGISQKPPVLPDFYQTLDLITQLQIFIIQTLLGHKQVEWKQESWKKKRRKKHHSK